MIKQNILILCSGNTCRSPMAEALCRAAAARRGLPVTVTGAGLAADMGQPAAENAQKAAAEQGLDLSAHRSRAVTRKMCDEADVIAVMSEAHRAALVSAGIAEEKIAVLGGGVPDPYGGDLETYRVTLAALSDAVEALLPPFSVRPLSAEHTAAVARLEAACFAQPWSEQALLEATEESTARFLVAVADDGTVCGYIGCHFVADEAFVTNVAVSESCRRQGVAAWLIAALSDRARQEGVTRLMLEVRVSNAAAIALYEKLGFVKDGVRPRFYQKPTEDAALYTLHL